MDVLFLWPLYLYRREHQLYFSTLICLLQNATDTSSVGLVHGERQQDNA